MALTICHAHPHSNVWLLVSHSLKMCKNVLVVWQFFFIDVLCFPCEPAGLSFYNVCGLQQCRISWKVETLHSPYIYKFFNSLTFTSCKHFLLVVTHMYTIQYKLSNRQQASWVSLFRCYHKPELVVTYSSSSTEWTLCLNSACNVCNWEQWLSNKTKTELPWEGEAMGRDGEAFVYVLVCTKKKGGVVKMCCVFVNQGWVGVSVFLYRCIRTVFVFVLGLWLSVGVNERRGEKQGVRPSVLVC